MSAPVRLVEAPRIVDRKGLPLVGPVRLSAVLPLFVGTDVRGLLPELVDLEDGWPRTGSGDPVLLRAGTLFRVQPNPGSSFPGPAFLVCTPA